MVYSPNVEPLQRLAGALVEKGVALTTATPTENNLRLGNRFRRTRFITIGSNGGTSEFATES